MAIDPTRVLGAPAVEGERAWTEADVALYHLGLGAGDPPTDERELEYVLEDRLKVLPSFGVLHSYPLVLRAITETPGLAIDLSSALHGSQEIEVRRPLPAAGAVRTRGRWVAVHDKGSSAVLEHETALVDAAGDELLVARASRSREGRAGSAASRAPRRATTCRGVSRTCA